MDIEGVCNVFARDRVDFAVCPKVGIGLVWYGAVKLRMPFSCVFKLQEVTG